MLDPAMGGFRHGAFICAIATATLFSGAARSDSLFPLAPGSSWTYRDLSGNEEILSIGSATEIMGVPMVEASYTGEKPFYYIVTRKGIARLEPTSPPGAGRLYGRLTLLLSWPLDPGRSWDSPWSDPPLIFTMLERGPVTVAAGTFRQAVRIGYRPATDPIYRGTMWFADGVGLLAHEENGSRLELVRYSLSDLLPPPAARAGIEELASLFDPSRKDRDGEVPGGDGSPSSGLMLWAVGAGVLFMMILALASYVRSLRVDVELEDDSRIQEGEAALASALVRDGLYGEAASILGRLTARHPQWPDIAALLGSAYRSAGRLEEACLELKRALTLNPDMPLPRLELARTYLGLANPARAMEEVEMVLVVHEGFADAVYLKGEALAAMGRESEAMVEFRKALSLNPSFDQAREALERVSDESPGE